MARVVKGEPGSRAGGGPEMEEAAGTSRQGTVERRAIRSRYLAVKNLISDEQEDVGRVDSDKFQSIIAEVETLHRHVQKPREQVADAEALLDLANNLITSVKAQTNEGMTPSDFVTALLRNFGQQDRGMNAESAPNIVQWVDVGLAVSRVFRSVPGCCTMIGPMNTEVKQRKTIVQRKRTRPAESARPEELVTEERSKTETDKNMSTMFDILRKKRNTRLEYLVFNRGSFAQTVENIFALSFLVKDGRAEISLNESGDHLVSPRNAPAATAVASGHVTYNHFVFRFDFKDWELMKSTVGVGEELMPHRCGPSTSGASQADCTNEVSQSAIQTTPIRKLSRNRGLVITDQAIADSVEDTRQKGKCRLFG